MSETSYTNGRAMNSNDTIIMGELFQQTRILGRIESKVEYLSEQVEINCQDIEGLKSRPRSPGLSAETLKQNWTVVLLVVQVAVFLLLQMTGHPDKAQQAWGSLPAFRDSAKAQD